MEQKHIYGYPREKIKEKSYVLMDVNHTISESNHEKPLGHQPLEFCLL